MGILHFVIQEKRRSIKKEAKKSGSPREKTGVKKAKGCCGLTGGYIEVKEVCSDSTEQGYDGIFPGLGLR